jgi:hypothetical protein
MAILKAVVLLAGLVAYAAADCYMMAPRGMNNRYRGDTNNQNRLYDSQNNANGGFGWGPQMSYYQGSLLQVEWTQQHGCGPNHPNVDCDIILQYMCGPWIQDGTTDNTVPTNFPTLPVSQQLQFGVHEPYSYWFACHSRNRNSGVFIADQNVGTTAENTRQNNNQGNNHGFECEEDRDYYPYWHPTPWRDIAVLTSGPLSARCNYFQTQSQNVLGKGQCFQGKVSAPTYMANDPSGYDSDIYTDSQYVPYIWMDTRNPNNQLIPAQQDQSNGCTGAGNTWVVVPPWNIPAPDCVPHASTRDNHLGNSDLGAGYGANNGGQGPATGRYLWILPSDVPPDVAGTQSPQSTCVLRIRYNISSGDYLGWGFVDGTGPMIDQTYNGLASPVKTSPTIMYGLDSDGNYRNLSLRINTNQYGRTFQDRSYVWYLLPRPVGVPSTARIYNLNVRGKRGNIVQVYPGVEYDFTPNNLNVALGDYIHFQWTGSDTQPAGNAGEGTDQTDRNNIVELADGTPRRNNVPMPITSVDMFDASTAFNLGNIQQPAYCNYTGQTGCCKTWQQLFDDNQGNTNNINTDPQNCNKLNAANAYFNGGLVSMRYMGTYAYMCTRNNNFTNRSQKGSINVQTTLPPFALSMVVVGAAGFVGIGIVGVGVFYAKTHANSQCANVFSGVRV